MDKYELHDTYDLKDVESVIIARYEKAGMIWGFAYGYPVWTIKGLTFHFFDSVDELEYDYAITK